MKNCPQCYTMNSCVTHFVLYGMIHKVRHVNGKLACIRQTKGGHRGSGLSAELGAVPWSARDLLTYPRSPVTNNAISNNVTYCMENPYME